MDVYVVYSAGDPDDSYISLYGIYQNKKQAIYVVKKLVEENRNTDMTFFVKNVPMNKRIRYTIS